MIDITAVAAHRLDEFFDDRPGGLVLRVFPNRAITQRVVTLGSWLPAARIQRLHAGHHHRWRSTNDAEASTKFCVDLGAAYAAKRRLPWSTIAKPVGGRAGVILPGTRRRVRRLAGMPLTIVCHLTPPYQ